MSDAVREALREARKTQRAIGSAPVFPAPKDPTKPCDRHLLDNWLRRAFPCSGSRHRAWSYASGADRDRTGDPLLAKQVLSQLSYRPGLILQQLSSYQHRTACTVSPSFGASDVSTHPRPAFPTLQNSRAARRKPRAAPESPAKESPARADSPAEPGWRSGDRRGSPLRPSGLAMLLLGLLHPPGVQTPWRAVR